MIMDGQGRYGTSSPLRNSKAVNRPFQSPLRSVLSPSGGKADHDKTRLENSNLRSSPYSQKLSTPKKTITSQPKLLAKEICRESKKQREDNKDEKRLVDQADLKKIRDRISAKKREVEHLRQQSVYRKKHESKDLGNLIKRWERGCQEALTQFQLDITQNNGTSVNITEILAQLGIPPKLVQYSVEDCDFV